ncbi:MAG: DNA replication and repair protein RecF [Scardovia wiggsiae]|nr:DNA replication and repair protein RecF [Scardovia wiggsiae]
MYISRLALDYFRSWDHCVLDLGNHVNVLFGHNGLGKTNIAEAVEFLSTGSSHRAGSSQPLIQHGQKSAVIRANVESGRDVSDPDISGSEKKTGTKPDQYTVTIPAKGANRARINNGPALYLRDIVGNIKTVSFTPEDQWLISLDPARRRSFLDSAGSQIIRDYFRVSQKYSHISKQRSALLKNIANRRDRDGGTYGPAGNGQYGGYVSQGYDGQSIAQDYSGLEVWTGQLISTGIELTRLRAGICDQLERPFSRIYSHIAGDSQKATLEYFPSFTEVYDFPDDPFSAISGHFQRLFEGEAAQARNLIGPHRDDIGFFLNSMPAREYASNGELWTLALALKMALFEILSEKMAAGHDERHDDNDAGNAPDTPGSNCHGTRNKPILILDDVFSQLDTYRRTKIVDFAAGQGQVLITAASRSDIPDEFISGNMDPHAGVKLIDVEKVRDNTDGMWGR